MIARRPEAAVYQQLATDLREKITDGRLRPGQMLPSEPRLGQEYGVARETVRRAVRLLVAEGLVSVQAGRGTWVREPAQKVEQPIQRRSRISGRAATSAEAQEMGLQPGAQIFVVTHGGREHKFPQDQVDLTIT